MDKPNMREGEKEASVKVPGLFCSSFTVVVGPCNLFNLFVFCNRPQLILKSNSNSGLHEEFLLLATHITNVPKIISLSGFGTLISRRFLEHQAMRKLWEFRGFSEVFYTAPCDDIATASTQGR
jgi:hypothetical protein